MGSGAGDLTKPSNSLIRATVAAFTLGGPQLRPLDEVQHWMLAAPGQRLAALSVDS